MRIHLTDNEALVLFELLYRINKEELFVHQAERCVLWSMEAQLEKELTAPHSDKYLEFLHEAREQVVKNY